MVVHAYYPHDESRVQREAKALVEMEHPALAGKHHSVDVICLRKDNEPQNGTADGVAFYRLPVKRHKNPNSFIYLFEYYAFFCLVLCKLTGLYFRKNYKIIHFHNPPDFLVLTAMIPKMCGAKITFDIHDLMPELYASKFNVKMNHPMIRTLIISEKIACKFADNIFIVTEIWKNRLLKRGVPAKKCKVLMNSPDETIFKSIPVGARASLRVPRPYNLVYHGTLVKRYGIDIAIKAIAIARGFVAPSGFDLVCAPAFTGIQINGEERTAIKLLVEFR